MIDFQGIQRKVRDDGPSILCRVLARILETEGSEVRIRIHQEQDETLARIIIFIRSLNDCVQRAELTEDLDTAQAIQRVLENLSMRRQTHDLTVIAHDNADFMDFDLEFNPQRLTERRGSALELYLKGLLSVDQQTSEREARTQYDNASRQGGGHLQNRSNAIQQAISV